jgi:ankyrin repeat protein
MEDIVNSLIPNPELEYVCSPLTKSTGFHLIHQLVLNTNKYPELNQYISDMIDKDPSLVDISNSKGWTPIILAARNSKTLSSDETVSLLIKKECNINAQTTDGWSALWCAAFYGCTDSSENTIKLLMDAGVDPNIVDVTGWTVLHLLCRCADNSSEKIIKMVLDYKGDPSIITNSGYSPLAIVSRYGRNNENIIKILLSKGANINIRNNIGESSIALAARNSGKESSERAVKILIEAKSDINAADNSGWTPLAHASYYSNDTSSENTVRMLIDAKANINAIIRRPESVLSLSILGIGTGKSTINTVRMLVDAGAYIDNRVISVPDNIPQADVIELEKLIISANGIPSNGWPIDNISVEMVIFVIEHSDYPPYQYIDYEIPLDKKIQCLIKNFRNLDIMLKNTKNGQMIYELCIFIHNSFNKHATMGLIREEIPTMSNIILYGPDSHNAQVARNHFISILDQ